MFNNREIATAIWLTLFAAWVFTKPEFRASFVRMVGNFLAWKVAATFMAVSLYCFRGSAATRFNIVATCTPKRAESEPLHTGNVGAVGLLVK